MNSSSSSGSSSLSRYRPAILITLGLVAACGIYYIRNNSNPPSELPPSQRPLRRRNALHGPNTRRTGGRQPRDITVQAHQSTEVSEDQPMQEAGNRLGLRPEDYGETTIYTTSGRQIGTFTLGFNQMPTTDTFESVYDLSRDEAVRARNALESSFLEGFLTDHFLVATPQIELVLRDMFAERDFQEANVSRSMNRHRSLLRDQAASGILQAQVERNDQNSNGRAAIEDAESEFSWRGEDNAPPSKEGQSLLNLLYHIAEDQARREGYVHRGVTCNSCGSMPIRGIRYRCANCIDFDLCETCEAMQLHPKTHLFYKVRIPAPFLGNPRQAQPVWYPGKTVTLARNLPQSLLGRLVKESGFEVPEVEALWDQFKCLAGTEWRQDPNDLGMAIDRRTFDKCFVPNTAIRPPPPNLIYDRMFAFYDTDRDGLIGFEEFLRGLASLNNKSKDERLRRIFQGYDIDGDGYVNRKDFLRMFRAFYALNKELTRDMVAGMEDDVMEGPTPREIILGSQPISSGFMGPISHEPSRINEGKRRDHLGDMQIEDDNGILRENGDDSGDRAQVVAEAAERQTLGPSNSVASRNPWDSMLEPQPLTESDRLEFAAAISRLRNGSQSGNEPGSVTDPIVVNVAGSDGLQGEGEEANAPSDEEFDNDDWPPRDTELVDVETALGAYIAIEAITNREDRAKVREATRNRQSAELATQREATRSTGLNERWQRRQFYIDEEDGSVAPENFEVLGEEEDNGEGASNDRTPETDSHPASRPRSRSSSKVRFQDDLTDTDYETRSNPSTSSRSIPVGERWGGYEIPEAEKDVGKEVLYQVTQQGLNEMLDPLFRKKEDLAMEALKSRAERSKWRSKLLQFENEKTKTKVKFEDQEPQEAIVEEPTTYPPAAEELHKSVSAFNELTDIEPSIHSKPLDELLEASGYTIGNAFADEDRPDSTLPQNRPDTAARAPDFDYSELGHPAPPRKARSSAAAKTTLLSSAPAFEDRGPSEHRLAKLSRHERVEKESAERGGAGRLSFAEFEEIMKGEKGRRLGFVGAWIEMASF
ncbi:MAG: hypothetical protein M1827_002050 [Pycnora praestabilis]|nr:MAG: hypothetical protein M1827_002050 [Pycnora praestabilis]